MLRSPVTRWVLGTLVFMSAVSVLRFHPWRRAESFGEGASQGPREHLTVGFLPVTCHLTCPVTSWVTEHSESGSAFRSKKYTNFSAIVEDLTAGNLKASFLLAPLAMVMNRKGTPVKIVHLGHRDGTTMMVRTDSPYRTFAAAVGLPRTWPAIPPSGKSAGHRVAGASLELNCEYKYTEHG